MTSVSDNTAIMASESVMAILAREGCMELERIAARDYAFPGHSELEGEIAKVQAVKKSFLRRFWKLSGRQVVQEAARRRLEEVCFFFFLLPFLSDEFLALATLLTILFLLRR